MELRNKVESVLFSAGKKVHIDELTRLCHANKEEVLKALKELKDWYDTKEESLMVMQEGDFWKLTVREKYLALVRKIVTATELSKTIMETLAVVAWKAPVKQSDVIKVRTNKAYDHLKELEEAGYITREKHGRTRLIKLSQKFFEYFDIPEDELKEKFKSVDQMSKAIEDKEAEIEAIKKEQERKAKEKEVDLIDKKGHKLKLDEYELSKEQKEKALLEEKPKLQPAEKLGDLEVVEETPKPEVAEEKPEEIPKPEVKEEVEKPKEKPERKEAPPPIKPEAKPEKQVEKPKAPEEERVLEISKEALEEAEKPKEKPKKEEKEEEIKEALEEIEEEKKEEKPKKAKAEPSEEAEADFEKRAEKRAEEILHPTEEEEMTPEVKAELDSMLHPEEKPAEKGEEPEKPEKAEEEEPEEEKEEAPEEPEEAEVPVKPEAPKEKPEKPKKKTKKPAPEKPDFEEEVKDIVETAGEEKAEIPESEGGPKDILQLRKEQAEKKKSKK